MVEVIGLLIVAIVAWYVALPLRSASLDSYERSHDDPLAELQLRREMLYREIADLDFDHRLGKVSEEDYRWERDGFVSEAAAVLETLEMTALEPANRTGSISSAEQNLEDEIRRLRNERLR